MNMDGSLGPAGRARGIEPEAGLVAMGRRGLGGGRRRFQQRFERAPGRLGMGDDDLGFGLRQQRHRRLHRRQYRSRHTTARARLSASIKANSFGLSWVLTATGTIPASIAPRKAVGKSIPS